MRWRGAYVHGDTVGRVDPHSCADRAKLRTGDRIVGTWVEGERETRYVPSGDLHGSVVRVRVEPETARFVAAIEGLDVPPPVEREVPRSCHTMEMPPRCAERVRVGGTVLRNLTWGERRPGHPDAAYRQFRRSPSVVVEASDRLRPGEVVVRVDGTPVRSLREVPAGGSEVLTSDGVRVSLL